MTRSKFVFNLLVTITFSLLFDSITVSQSLSTPYSTKRIKSVTFGQHANMPDSDSENQQNKSNIVKNCDEATLEQPLPFPVRFPKGSKEMALLVVFDDTNPWPTELFQAKLQVPKGVREFSSSNCKKFKIRSGQAWASQVLATFSLGKGEVFPIGSYKMLLFAGEEKAEIEIPFTVE